MGEDPVVPRPRIGRRRLLVALGSVAGVVFLVIALTPASETAAGIGLQIGCGLAGVSVLWLLADCARPWIDDPAAIGPEERAHADAALRSSYGVLFHLSLLLLFAPLLAGSILPGGSAGDIPVATVFAVVVLFLPLAVAAWTEPAHGFDAPAVGIRALLRSRIRRGGVLPYAISAAAGVMIMPMLALPAAERAGAAPGLIRGIATAAVLVAIVGGALCLRALVEHSLDRSGRRPS